MAQSENTTQTPKIFLILRPLIENDQGKIKPEVLTGLFVSAIKDEQRDYRWKTENIGIRTNLSLGIFTIYSELFHEKSTWENLAVSQPLDIHKEINLEFGYGLKIPVKIAETGIKFEGELTNPFGDLRPSLEVKIGWTNERFEFNFGNKFIPEYASIFNPTLFVGCKF